MQAIGRKVPVRRFQPIAIFYFIGDGMGIPEVTNAQLYNKNVLKNDCLSMQAIGRKVPVRRFQPIACPGICRLSVWPGKHFINAFGEEVMVHNTDAALAKACSATGAEVLNYIWLFDVH